MDDEFNPRNQPFNTNPNWRYRMPMPGMRQPPIYNITPQQQLLPRRQNSMTNDTNNEPRQSQRRTPSNQGAFNSLHFNENFQYSN